jgi:ribosome-associated heat shock protein Hsp15
MPRCRNPDTTNSTHEGVRIDKWLWAARFYKTRSIATTAIEAGHVRVNGTRCRPARGLHIDDLVHITRGTEEIELRVVAISSLRGPAPVAQGLYEETAASRDRRQAAAEQRRLAPGAAPIGARPTKRDRRRIDRLRGEDD